MPSTAHSLGDWWTSLRRDSPASPTQPPANVGELGTNGTSGLRLSESSMKWDPGTSSWRTSQASYLEDVPPTGRESSESFPRAGMTSGGTLWALTTWAHPTDASGGSASEWPTPTATPYGTGNNYRVNEGQTAAHRPSLATLARKDNWPTPSASSGGTHTGVSQEVAQKELESGRKRQIGLGASASLWPTPDTTNVGDGTPYETLQQALIARRERTKVAVKEGRVKPGSGRSENLAMAVQASMWMTPNTMDSLAPKSQAALDHEYTHRKGRSNPNNLRDQVVVNAGERTWPTPSAHDGRRPGSDATSTQGGNLKREGENWATPQARDYKDGADPAATIPTNGMLGRQAPRTAMAGPESSQSDQTSPPQSARRLNPSFVEWLMGLPVGWTDSKPLATGSFRRWLRSFFGG